MVKNQFTFRPNSMDYIIYSFVVNNNEYNLPFEFAPNDVIVDIGAHIGSFIYAVLDRGAGSVYAVEAARGNYQLSCDHLDGVNILKNSDMVVECLIGKLKHFRRVFSLFDKLVRRCLGFVHSTSALICLR